MAARLSVEERLDLLETRMTALEDLPNQIDRLETQLSARIDDARRETRVLYEDILVRLGVLGEGLGTLGARVSTLSDKVDRNFTTLSAAIDGSRGEARTMFETLVSRLAAIEDRLPARQRKAR